MFVGGFWKQQVLDQHNPNPRKSRPKCSKIIESSSSELIEGWALLNFTFIYHHLCHSSIVGSGLCNCLPPPRELAALSLLMAFNLGQSSFYTLLLLAILSSQLFRRRVVSQVNFRLVSFNLRNVRQQLPLNWSSATNLQPYFAKISTDAGINIALQCHYPPSTPLTTLFLASLGVSRHARLWCNLPWRSCWWLLCCSQVKSTDILWFRKCTQTHSFRNWYAVLREC